MSELIPCPFCGSGWLYETRRDGYCDETPTMFCNSCKAVVTWEQVEEEGVNDETRTFVREHWNTRAQTVFGMTLDEVRQMMKRDAERERTCHADEVTHRNCKYSINRGWRELTCKIEQRIDDWGAVTRHCGNCGADLDCDTRNRQNYCPNCGRKVMA